MVFIKEIDDTNYFLCGDLERKPCRYDGDEKVYQFVGSAIDVISVAYANRTYMTAYGIFNDDTMIGMVNLIELHEYNEYRFNNLFIADNHQGKGYACEAVKCILEKFKSERKFEVVSLCVHKSNEIAIHIYQKSGFICSDGGDDDFNMMRIFI